MFPSNYFPNRHFARTYFPPLAIVYHSVVKRAVYTLYTRALQTFTVYVQ